MKGRVLICAGSDSGGGAGIQADIKTVTCLGGYAMTAVTALTAQNTEGVFGVVGVEPDFIVRQIELALTDIGADAIKTGMLHSGPVMEAVAGAIAPLAATVPVVVDPVMVAKGGHPLLEPDAVAVLKRVMLPLAAVLTPNLPEAERLAGLEITDLAGMKKAAEMLRSLGPAAVLVKGGHLEGPVVHDVLAEEGGVSVFDQPRIETRHTHGTGCTLASAIATGLAQGLALREAVGRARRYLEEALRRAPGYGRGHGPVDHAHTVVPFD